MQRGQISLNRKFFSFGHCKTIYVAVSREFVKLIRLRQFSKAIQELQAARFQRQTLFRKPLGIEQPGYISVKFQQRYVKSHRKVPPTPSHLPCDLSWFPSSSPTGGSSCRRLFRQHVFPVLPKSYAKAFWHRAAPCSPRASRKFGLTYRGFSGSFCFCAGFALVRAIPVPARPCEEASQQRINLLGGYDFLGPKAPG